ncbi:MAG TPA: hypothetical protein VGS97_23015 [Actinocrinis sp.]|uniref:hypothetical protein n=1 Tax=Actinocrinis sp. TaxID=1920516 RepID=UPI002DDD7BA9|nr:hypothetical protein [Actinocrinis sp.]HEV2346991.1 hypothetical protein [Actinocrinis sp.]
MDTPGPASRVERQRARAHRGALAFLERDHVPFSTEAILAIARAQRHRRPTPGHDQASGLLRPTAFELAELLPPERVLYLRVFSGTTTFSRRRAVRAWQHKLRVRREQVLAGTGRPAFDAGDDQHTTAMTPRERDAAYDALPGPAAALYRQLGACPINQFDTDTLAVLIDLDAPAAERLPKQLVGCGLLDQAGDGFALSPHALLHARIKSEASDAEQRELDAAGLDRLLAFLRDAADAAARLIAPGRPPLWEREQLRIPAPAPPFPPDGQAAAQWVDARAQVYLDTVRFAFADQRYALVCDLAYCLWPLWMRRRTGRLIEALTLGLAAARLAYSDRATGWMLTALADATRAVSPVAAYGHGRRAVTHCEHTGDTVGLAWALSSLGGCLLDADQTDQADTCFRDAQALHATLGHARGVALARQGRGLVALSRGEAEAAVELLDGAHRALAQAGDRYGAALCLAHHARALAADGDPQRALLELDLASGVLHELHATRGEALTLNIRSQVLRAAGLESKARDADAAARALLHADPHRAAHLDQPGAASSAGLASPDRPQ